MMQMKVRADEDRIEMTGDIEAFETWIRMMQAAIDDGSFFVPSVTEGKTNIVMLVTDR
jgi:hypothetical protein